MAGDKAQTIIIIKKKGHHEGHHGGAWKVAYADFVTAMMAFFIVMWLMNSNEQIKEAVAGYFSDPSGHKQETGSGAPGSSESLSLSKDDMINLKDRLEEAMKELPKFQELKDQVSMTVTGEGLRIELIETEGGMFFESGRPEPSQNGRQLLTLLAGELGRLPNNLLIEGHTDARPFVSRSGYSNWELSTDRSNQARRLMESTGLQMGQVTQVRGFADHELRKPEAPADASNRRVSVIVRYLHPPAAPREEQEADQPSEHAGEENQAEPTEPASAGGH